MVRSRLRRLQAGLMLQLLRVSSVWHQPDNGYSVKLTLVITDSLTPTTPPPTNGKPSLNCHRCFLQKSNLTSAAERRPHFNKTDFMKLYLQSTTVQEFSYEEVLWCTNTLIFFCLRIPTFPRMLYNYNKYIYKSTNQRLEMSFFTWFSETQTKIFTVIFKVKNLFHV